MDKRQLKTRKFIFDAFSELLSKKDYKDITIQDIIDEATIGRTTFYSHFDKKETLMEALCKEVFERVFCLEFNARHTHNQQEKKQEFIFLVESILKNIKNTDKRFLLIFNSNRTIFLSYFKIYINKFFYGSLFEYDHNFFEPTNAIIATKILESSFVGILEYWEESEFKLCELELAKEFVSIFNFSDIEHCDCIE